MNDLPILRMPTAEDPPEQGAVVSARGLSKTYGAITALADASLDVHAGEVVALVGDNGAGKSTLVKLLSGAVAASAGRIAVDGEFIDVRSPHDARRAGIETVYQDLALAPNLTIASNVFLGRELYVRGVGRALGILDYKRMNARATREMDQLHIRVPSVRARCETLSGGQRQAVAVARAATWGSKLVIMDEPTAALGVEEQEQVGELISEISGRGMGVLLVSHNLPQVHELSTRVLVMFQGRLIANLLTSEYSVRDIVTWITGAAISGSAETA